MKIEFPLSLAGPKNSRTPKSFQTMQRARSATPPMPDELKAGYAPTAPKTKGKRRAAATEEGAAKRQAAATEEGALAAAAQRMEERAQQRAQQRVQQGRKAPVDAAVAAMATERGLTYCETTLMLACDSVMHVGLDKLTGLCKKARVTPVQIEVHAREIGVQEILSCEMVKNLTKFVHFMHLAEKVQILQFEAKMAGRTLLGYQMIHISRQEAWQALIAATCGYGKYFRAKSTVYELLLKFGFGGNRDPGCVPVEGLCKGKSTDNKDRVVLYSRILFFDEEKLENNVKRYTNSQSKAPAGGGKCDGLGMLLAVAYEEQFGA